jgi:4-hydroxy-tetrahydrodipicolinate reductase
MIRVAVAGAAGNMGATTCEAVEGADDLDLTGRADPALGVGLEAVLEDADVLVDFTVPDSAKENALVAVAAGVHAVIGTTGFELDELRDSVVSARVDGANVFVAPNFAIGAVLMIELSKRVVKHMPDCEITEYHRREKLDAPSGTAKHTAEAIGEAGGEVNAIHSVRLPGLVAHQEVIFGGEGQTLTIRHDSMDRRSFMPGVLLAVRRVRDLPDPFTVGLDKLL